MHREDMRFDIRTQKHRLRRGEITHDSLAEFLEQLPDEAEEAVETDTRFESLFSQPESDED
jgi:hypothetical protein